MRSLREYQSVAVDSMLEHWLSGGSHGLVVLPTGSGKSLVAAELVRRLSLEHGARILLATHVSELISQNVAEIQTHWPAAPVGIYSAGLRKRDGSAPIVFAGIQSIHRNPEVVGPRDVLLIDECFPTGTRISTPQGTSNIEDLSEGCSVLNAFGVGKVLAVSRTYATELTRIELSNGKVIKCTANHPIFSRRGWINASRLMAGDQVFCKEGVRSLQDSVRGRHQKQEAVPGEQILLKKMQRCRGGSAFYKARSNDGLSYLLHEFRGAGKNLLNKLRENTKPGRLQSCEPGAEKDLSALQVGVPSEDKDWRNNRCLHMGEDALLLDLLLQESGECDVDDRNRREGERYTSSNGAQAESSGREWEGSYQAAGGDPGMAGRWLGSGVCAKNGAEEGGPSALLQDRRCEPGHEDSDRAGWSLPRGQEACGRQEEGFVSGVVRVESVSTEKCSSAEPVFNLCVSGHPSYFAEGTLVHNCHLTSHRDSGMYRSLIKWLEAKTPGMRIGGLTATPFRLSTGRLDEDYGEHKALFEKVVYEAHIVDLIQQGFLCPITPYNSPELIDVSEVKKSAGEYNLKQLAAAVDVDSINARVVAETIAAGEHRRTWLAFASSIDHANHLCGLFRASDISCEIIVGDTPQSEREKFIARARSGDLRCLVGVGVLTTGINIPNVDLIAMVRPTTSLGLFIQMLGRGTRTAPGKSDCLLLDFTNNSLSFPPIDMADGNKTPGEKGKAPSKECPECHAVCHASAEICKSCGYNFPLNTMPNYRPVAGTAPVFSTQTEPKWWWVEGIIARRHTKFGAADSLRIEYECGLLSVSMWLALENEKVSGMARRWWERNSYSGEAPKDVSEALERIDDLRIPGRIQVMREGKYDRILEHDYSIPPGKVIPVRKEITRWRTALW